MTNEEAKAYFEMRLSDTVRYVNGKQTRQREAFELAVNALEKQIPKKPLRKGFSKYCPSCESDYIYSEETGVCLRHCIDCGQKLDWK